MTVDDRQVGAIDRGLVVLLGVERADGPADRDYIASKICELRIFPDADGRMNRSVTDIGGGVLVLCLRVAALGVITWIPGVRVGVGFIW